MEIHHLEIKESTHWREHRGVYYVVDYADYPATILQEGNSPEAVAVDVNTREFNVVTWVTDSRFPPTHFAIEKNKEHLLHSPEGYKFISLRNVAREIDRKVSIIISRERTEAIGMEFHRIKSLPWYRRLLNKIEDR